MKKTKATNRGFTLIELIVVIAIIVTLSGIILFSVSIYINKGKDSNISGNLAILIPAGEVYYNGNNPYGYKDFCNPSINSVINNMILQMPQNSSGDCTDSVTPGVCCNVNLTYDAWAACAKEFTNTNPSMAYCVDSRGVKKEIDNTNCTNLITQCL